jgi:hypothetical protein
MRNLSLFSKKAELENPNSCPFYFENFARLGLFVIESISYADENLYNDKWLYKKTLDIIKEKIITIPEIQQKILEGADTKYECGHFRPTDYEKLFLEVVTDKI